uniref:Beta-1,4-galactosyltransferase n=1 Tax=Arion vulgaris TaxID=1028688 RepID=A0A0B6Y9G1_9EUPU
MMFTRLLRKKRVGQALTLLGLTTIILCLWTAQQEWEYHSSDTNEAHPLRRHLNGDHRQEYVVVNSLLDEIRGDVEDEHENKSHQVHDDVLDNEVDKENFVVEPEEIFKLPNSSSLETCPLYPNENLVGRLAGLKNDITPEELAEHYPEVEMGGRVRPKHCRATEKVAIIIPFRNRFKHLYILLNNLIPMLQRQLIDARFFVIEQAMPTVFNRATLFNIGFLEALKYENYDCFIFHDVDLIPVNDRNLYRCDEHPMHFAAAMDKYNYELPYKKYFGGVVGFTRYQYRKINGNSNLYFGWGGEDDDLFERIDNKKYEIARPYLDVGRYDMVHHKQDAGNADNCDRKYLLKSARQRQDKEGLNSVKYKRKYIKVQSHMTWINIYIDKKETLATAPDYVRKELKMIEQNAKNKACNFTRDSPIRE